MVKSEWSETKKPQDLGWKILLVLSWITLLALAWALAFRIVASAPPVPGIGISDLAALLFGASSIAMFAVSFFIGIVALLGWGAVKEHIQDEVKISTSERLARLEREIRGRFLDGLGFVIGELCTSPDSLEPSDPDRLAICVAHCKQGYKVLRELGEKTEFLALNNLVYYTAILGDDGDREFLREQALKLRTKGQEHEVARLLLTYCRVIVGYSNDPQEKADALAVVRGLLKKGLAGREEREAKLYEQELSRPLP